MTSVVDIGRLGEVIKKTEQMWAEEGLNDVDIDLVLREINGRLNMRRQQQHTKDLMGSLPLGGLIKRFTKAAEKDGDE